MGTLSREILKWLQSLDLSYSVKDCKRDLSNGFLVAEIMSRYFPGEIGLYSFDNGTKLATKNDNWEQLYNFFRKKKLPIGKLDFDPVIHCVPGAAVLLTTKVYKLLTRREVPQFPETKGAKGAALEEGKTAQLDATAPPPVEESPDRRGKSRPQMDNLDLHTMAHSGRDAEAKQVSQAVDIAPLDIKEVQYKQVTKSVTQLRVASDMQMSQRSRAGTSASGRRSVDGASPSGYGVVKPALDLMKPIVQPVLNEYPETSGATSQLDPSKDPVQGFLELCHALLIPENVSVRVFEALGHRAPLLAESLLRSPTEYWKVWTMLQPGLHAYDETSPVFEALVFLLKRLGESMMDVDAAVLQALFLEMGLPLLVDVLVGSPGKRELICELLVHQVRVTEHLSLLRTLKKRLPLEVFIQCLAHLANTQGLAQALDEYALDLYVYYGMIACHNPQPKVRTSGLVVLCAVAGPLGHPHLLLPMSQELEQLGQDPWWEVQAQILMLAARLLGHLATRGEQEAEEQKEALLRVIRKLFRPGASRHVLQIGLMHTARLLEVYPELMGLWVECILTQKDPSLRQRLLTAGPARLSPLVMGPTSRLYEEKAVTEFLPKLAIAKACLAQVEEAGVPRLELEHAEVLAAMCAEPLDPEWEEFYGTRLMAYVLVALVDPALHAVVRELLINLWTDPQIGQACLDASQATLVKSLRVRYSDVERAKVEEEDLLTFFRRLLEADAERAASVRQVLQAFKQEHGAEFARSQLASLL